MPARVRQCLALKRSSSANVCKLGSILGGGPPPPPELVLPEPPPLLGPPPTKPGAVIENEPLGLNFTLPSSGKGTVTVSGTGLLRPPPACCANAAALPSRPKATTNPRAICIALFI